MTPAQALYPLIALSEITVLVLTGRSRAQNAAALQIWLMAQLVIFAVLEPLSLRSVPFYAQWFLVCSVLSAAADLIVLYAIFCGLEDGMPALGSLKAWGLMALFTGMLFCLAAELPMPLKARGIEVAWLTFAQTYSYLRMLGLIALALYGGIRASSWPRDLAYTWLAMALYGMTEAVVQRIQIGMSNTNLFEIATSVAALAQLAGFWRALCYSPKPLNLDEISGLNDLGIQNSQES